MQATQLENHAQATLWNGPAGEAWVESKAVLDEMFRPFEHRLVEMASQAKARKVLDVGCGTGSTTLALARALDGLCTGVDISAPMLAAAREQAQMAGLPAEFIEADVQSHDFVDAGFDLIVSRFGVMFFERPVLAFARLRQAAAPGAALCCIAWRSAAENPFMTTAERTAAPLMPELPSRPANGPGQFAFADREQVASYLAEAGWSEIDIQPLDMDCTLPEAALAGYVTRVGQVGMAMQALEPARRAQVAESVLAAFAPFIHQGEARYTAACWQIQARVDLAA